MRRCRTPLMPASATAAAAARTEPPNSASPAMTCQLRTSHADREQAIDVLKAAFVQGRLTKDEFDLRVGQVFAPRTYAELGALPPSSPAG